MSKFLSPEEMRRIQELDAALKAKAPAPKPEPIEYRPLICVEISRCVKGPPGWLGLFAVNKIESKGKKVSKTLVVEGRDIQMAIAAIETTVRARVFK